MTNGKRKHAFGANSKCNICEQISSYLILSFGSSKGCLLGIVFSAACSLSLTLPLYSNGSGLVSCVALALPLGVLVFVVLSLLARSPLSLANASDRETAGRVCLHLRRFHSLRYGWYSALLLCTRDVFLPIASIY